jgi:hypothetical protein
LEPDLDAARVEGGFREDVFHDAAGTFPGALILLLRNVHPQPWLDVFAVLPVHALASFTFREGNSGNAIDDPMALYITGCEFSAALTLFVLANVEGNSRIRAWCGQKNAEDSVAQHGTKDR